MRCILGFCVVLAVATPAWAQDNVPGQEPFSQQSAVSTPVPNIHAPGGAAVTTQPSTVPQATATAPGATGSAAAPTTMAPAGNVTYYYYYPAGNTGRVYRMAAPTTFYSTNSNPVYTTPAQTYYMPVRRGFPFGLFRRRFAQPAYTTAAYTTTPTYYTTPGYYYTPTTYTFPGTRAPTGVITTGTVSPSAVPGNVTPVYTPTTFTAPTETTPPVATTPSGTTAPSGTTTRSSGTVPSRSIPAPPPVNPK